MRDLFILILARSKAEVILLLYPGIERSHMRGSYVLEG